MNLPNQYPVEALVAFTNDYGVVEVSEYDYGQFLCYTDGQSDVWIMPHELHPLNHTTEHYLVTSVSGENAWWLETGVHFDEVTDLTVRLEAAGLPVPVDIHLLTTYQLKKLNDLLLLANEGKVVNNPFSGAL